MLYKNVENIVEYVQKYKKRIKLRFREYFHKKIKITIEL